MIDMAAVKWAAVKNEIDAKAYKLYLENEIKGASIMLYDERLITNRIIPFLHSLYEPYEEIHRAFLQKGEKSLKKSESPKTPKNLKKLEVLKKLQKEKELSHMTQLIIECAKDMILFIINDVCKGFWQSGKVYALSGTCLSIAIKLITAYDFGSHRKLLADISARSDVILQHVNICPKKLLIAMEKDILERTDYKGCHYIIGINKVYNAENNNLTIVKSPRSPTRRSPHLVAKCSKSESPTRRKTPRNKSPRSGSAANP
jgi:hypothetical protein